ncbi:MAG TPA: ComEC/Rec2 family competence protein [Candidatus Saccharimonadales bacterium]|nr:ComEC/Rec2 family competence protein [Candidatus Saccharimonadales bacterium]
MSKVALVIISIFLLGGLLFRFFQFYHSNPTYHDGEEVSLVTTLQAEPLASSGGQKFSFRTPVGQLISVTADADPQLHYGQIVTISGRLQSHSFEDGTSILSLYHPMIVVKKASTDPLSAFAHVIKSRTETLYNKALPQIPASLLMGIVFGSKEQFPANFWGDLQATGVLHVIAASGMNVTFVSAAMLYTLGFFFRRQTALIIGSLGIIFYIFLVGFQASILRASIMGLLAFGAGLLGRQHMAAIALVISGYVLLLWQPSFLFDVGFELSFMATLGILFLKPLIPLPDNFITESFTTTLAAQLGTLPILLGVFGQIGLLSVLVNALVLWTVPLLMIFGSVAALVGLAVPVVGELLVYPVLPFLVYFQSVVSYFGQSDWVFHVTDVSPIVWIGYYSLLIAWVFLKKKKIVLRSDPLSPKSVL